MKKRMIFMAVMGLALAALPQVSPEFSTYFLDRTLRIDYYHIGDAKEEWIALDRLYLGGPWAGSLKNLVDPFNQGRYCIKVLDAEGKMLLYSKGFDTYYGEYKTTDTALNGVKRAYHESALIPFPKAKVLFVIERRDRENIFHPLFRQEIDPADTSIFRPAALKDVKVFEMVKNGDPHAKVDIAILAEGYTADEEPKVKKDLERFQNIFFRHEPYKTFKDRFNVHGVFRPSEESGISEPSHGSFKRTALGCTFDSLGSERYVLTEDNRTVRDTAGAVPYDAILIMFNTARYGGGGIYGLFATFPTDNQWHEYVFLHEFGHSFSGLADEYYSSSTAYNDFYPKGVEPVDPNITALRNPPDVKWKALVTPGTAIPTPWEKADFDKMDAEYQKVRKELNTKIAAMKREGAPKEEVEKLQAESELLSKQAAQRMDAYLAKSAFAGKVGAFKGAGYSITGLYRPMLDCLMFSKGSKPLCKVCADHVAKVIRYLTE
jgi:hypothetical protein